MNQSSDTPTIDQGYFWQGQASPEKITYLQKYAVPHTALDIGCGAGWYTHFLARQGFQVASVDLVPRMPGGSAASLAVARAEALPFASQSFDTVLMFDVLEHVSDESAALAELARVTRQRLILSVPSSDDSVLYSYGLSLLHHIDKTHVREYSSQGLTQKLETAGFSVADIYLSKAPQMPLLIQEFFAPGALYQPFRWATLVWIKALMRLRIVSNQIAGDIFCVAERRPGAGKRR